MADDSSDRAVREMDWLYYRGRMGALETGLRRWSLRRLLGPVAGLGEIPVAFRAVEALAREEVERMRDRLFAEQLQAREAWRELRPRTIYWLNRAQSILKFLEPDELVLYYECVVGPGGFGLRTAFEERAGEILQRRGTRAQRRRFRQLQYRFLTPEEKALARVEAVAIQFSRLLEQLEEESQKAVFRLADEPRALPVELKRLWDLYNELEKQARTSEFWWLEED